MSILLICDILGLFVNTLTTDDKYSLHNRTNLPQPIQMGLSEKQNRKIIFCWISEIYIRFYTFANRR